MLKHTSVGSSTPQVRNGSSLHKFKYNGELDSLLEGLPFTFQIVKETCKNILENHTFYAWKRPAHLRSHWLFLTEKGPAIVVDSRNIEIKWSLKFPYDKRQIQKLGTIICECAFDSHDSTLWIWDILYYEKQDLWSNMPYSKRWEILQKQLRPIIQENHPLCDIHVQYPTWTSLQQIMTEHEEPGFSIEFQPEKNGQRRFLWIIPKKIDTFHPANYHERKMISEQCQDTKPQDTKPQDTKPQDTKPQSKVIQVGILRKDMRSKLPDTYKVFSKENKDLGLAAIKSIDLSIHLRKLFQNAELYNVEIKWYEPFQKYEVLRIL
uniref:mRNA capping enzyme adenylation domain-containing protein n=1 Tax=viral metagenome TaxID=1070528 RepID=A0A6C0HES6_9ZZZZ